MLDLPGDEVHVWLIPAGTAASVASLLDTAEQAQAARFTFDHGRELYVAAHGGLRLLLGRYLDEPPAALLFETQADGKPSLAGDAPLRFNLSHSGETAAVAVARDREVGVDLERRRGVHSEAGVARRIMDDAEHARYAALPEAERADFLLWLWARKEALVKAAGVGIRASLRGVSSEPGPADRFAVVDLQVPGYAAAVAAEGHDWRPVVQELGATG